jgi:hypothetical protein
MSTALDKMIAVYRAPGPHFGPPHTTYDCKGVTEEDLQAALDEGWHLQFLDALAAAYDIGVVESDDIEQGDDAPPTRDEMEQQAEQIGLKVDKRWSDQTLSRKIQDAMQAG